MKVGAKKYAVHTKGDREIISVSLPLRYGELLEKYCELRNVSRSEAIHTALSVMFNTIGMEVREK